ncbi:F-box associated interaction domain, partial [Arabidopsis thaliana x Arabidopsis arenosa]
MSNQQSSSQLISLHKDGLYLFDLNKTTLLKLDLPFTLPPQTEPVCILQCHGMMCLTLKDNNELAIWKPTSKKFERVPMIKPGQTKNLLGFGYDRVSNDYKIVTIIDQKTYIFRFKEYCFFKDRTGTVLDHCMYWIADKSNKEKSILCFDFVNEEYSNLKVPMMLSGLEFNSWLDVSRGQLCVINHYPSLEDNLCVCRREIRSGKKIARWDSDPWMNIAGNDEEPADIRFACIARNYEVFVVVRSRSKEEEDKVLVYNKEQKEFMEVPFSS